MPKDKSKSRYDSSSEEEFEIEVSDNELIAKTTNYETLRFTL